MRRMLIDGPCVGKIIDFGEARYFRIPISGGECIYVAENINDPGDEQTGRRPCIQYVAKFYSFEAREFYRYPQDVREWDGYHAYKFTKL